MKARTVCTALAAASTLLGILVLAGWQFDIEKVKSLVPGHPTMNPVTALLFILTGASLLMAQLAPDSRAGRALGASLAVAVASLGIARLGDHLSLWSLGIDSHLFPSRVADSDARIGLFIAMNFLVIGVALTAVYKHDRRWRRAAVQLAALLVGTIALMILVGYVYGAGSLHGPMALHTALGFLALSAAMLCLFPERGLIGLLQSTGPGGTLVRRLMPAVVVIPLLLGWLRLLGQRAGVFSFEIGTALVIVSTIVALAGLAWWSALALERAEVRRQQAEATLRESEERSRLLFESIPIPAWVYDLETLAFLAVNNAAVDIYGYGKEEFAAMTIKDIRPPEDVPALMEAIAKIPDSQHSDGLWRHRRKDGALIDVEITSHALMFEGHRAELVLAQDVTERNRVEAALRASEEQFRTLATTANDAIISADKRGCITYLNASAERMFGYESGEVVGTPLTILMPASFHAAHRRGLERYLRTGEARVVGKTVELVGLRKDRSEFPIELSLASWTRGSETAFTGIIRDISDRKRSDEMLKRYADQLKAANAELDAFAYSVSHDLRAPLRSIEGFSLALLEDCGDRLNGSGREHLQRIRGATKRMAMLIEDMLELSRVTRASLRNERVDLSVLAETILAELAESEPDRHVQVRVEPGAVATGDPRLLRVMLDNLLRNAWKYTRKQSQAQIEFGMTRLDSGLTYYVRDNGVGFDMAYVDKLFHPFQRLHSSTEFEGTGVGLASVERIVKRHGGGVWAEGAVDEGATVYFTL